ncbi:alginate O-acetyltransferase AlgX-related protein [Butyrivibrio proteoclasticus]|uniref:alginate O-acetyltransferase AlgX-related protein n=1 Tax=Butyrivibrio proteoclasticus TaxID=43305 RepID=UPI0004797D9A|nr:hypothetical protein [Butyrivibrio proteoclasticus]
MFSRKAARYLYTTIFVALIAILGTLSLSKLCNFYINDEKDLIEWTPQLGSKFETEVASNFSNKFEFINLNGAVRNLIGQKSMNGVIKLDNTYLLTTMNHCSDESIDKFADNLSAFNTYLDSKGIPLLYASTPYTLSKYGSELPTGVEDYGNDNIDRLIAALNSRNIDTIDFRQTMHDDGIEHYDMMYRTDHHWTTEAGFYAFGKIEDYIVSKTGCTIDPRVSDIKNYTITNYPKWHLGSRGQRTGIYYAGIDDFNLILPDFDTSISGYSKTGTVQDVMINMQPLENRNYRSKHTYDFVLGGTLGHYNNLNSPNDLKILFITDSFGYAVGEYMIMDFKEVEYQYDQNSKNITPDYIEKYNPDVVVMLCYPQIISDDSTSFDYEAFKTR